MVGEKDTQRKDFPFDTGEYRGNKIEGSSRKSSVFIGSAYFSLQGFQKIFCTREGGKVVELPRFFIWALSCTTSSSSSKPVPPRFSSFRSSSYPITKAGQL